MPRKLDTRLEHLLKLQREANRDVQRYVMRKWPVKSGVRFDWGGALLRGEVVNHNPREDIVTVLVGGRLLRVPYAKIHDRRMKT